MMKSIAFKVKSEMGLTREYLAEFKGTTGLKVEGYLTCEHCKLVPGLCFYGTFDDSLTRIIKTERIYVLHDDKPPELFYEPISSPNIGSILSTANSKITFQQGTIPKRLEDVLGKK